MDRYFEQTALPRILAEDNLIPELRNIRNYAYKRRQNTQKRAHGIRHMMPTLAATAIIAGSVFSAVHLL